MTEEQIKDLKQLLIEAANFIQDYADGGNEAERIVNKIDDLLDKTENIERLEKELKRLKGE